MRVDSSSCDFDSGLNSVSVRRSKKDWLCDKTHAGIEAEDVMQYLDLISNACPEELPNLLRFNGDDRVLRIMAIYHMNKVRKYVKSRRGFTSEASSLVPNSTFFSRTTTLKGRAA